MAYEFATDDWVKALKDELNSSAGYKKAAEKWASNEHGHWLRKNNISKFATARFKRDTLGVMACFRNESGSLSSVKMGSN